MKPNLIPKILVAILILVIIGVSMAVWQKNKAIPGPDNNEPVACTLEAKICPDGTAVGRQGPRCEFTACPNSDGGLNATSTDTVQGVSFRYPKEISRPFVSLVDWPPKIQITNDSFTCTEAGVEIDRAGVTKKETINGRTYCVTKESEGAAGSVYAQYAYAFPFDSKTAIFTFTLRYPQCTNYDEPNKTMCENQWQEFNLIGVVDSMAQTVTKLSFAL